MHRPLVLTLMVCAALCVASESRAQARCARPDPDSHLFRVEKGKIRFVHTLTVCTIPGCGFNVRPQQSK